MPTKKDVAIFTLKVIAGGAKGTGKITYKTVKFTVNKAKEKYLKGQLEQLERTRKAIVVTLDALQEPNQDKRHVQQRKALVAQNEKALFRTIATLNHHGFGIKYHGRGQVEFADTDATD